MTTRVTIMNHGPESVTVTTAAGPRIIPAGGFADANVWGSTGLSVMEEKPEDKPVKAPLAA